ncbi:MAG: type II toxin-antitoxin system VapC family toxin [Kordiimonadaceae bacterium]|nr:type II toxin-antitoxin system VapC family toxin [Kordiimonadaceae bacterium]MBO6570046.1 type II toxin-antitoxin system VapC family toxin [Kordiimonadaceae bacterium]MBO6965857.1 type II toxin-antitoxin system VapC family toxin [Kordiimonadaceae bacterium]
MIVLDTSAVMALLLEDESTDALADAVVSEDLIMSAGTYSELLVVALNRGLADTVKRFVADLGVRISPVDADAAQQVANAFQTWGRGRHAAGLNFADCYAYALAVDRELNLLCAGPHFAKTDVELHPASA